MVGESYCPQCQTRLPASATAPIPWRYCPVCGAQIAYDCPHRCGKLLPVRLRYRCADDIGEGCGLRLRACLNPSCARYFAPSAPTDAAELARALACVQCGSPLGDFDQTFDWLQMGVSRDAYLSDGAARRRLWTSAPGPPELPVDGSGVTPRAELGACGAPALRLGHLFAGSESGRIVRWDVTSVGVDRSGLGDPWLPGDPDDFAGASSRLSLRAPMHTSELYLHMRDAGGRRLFVIDPATGARLLRWDVPGFDDYSATVLGRWLAVLGLRREGDSVTEHLAVFDLPALMAEVGSSAARTVSASLRCAKAVRAWTATDRLHEFYRSRVECWPRRVCRVGDCLYALSTANQLWRLRTDDSTADWEDLGGFGPPPEHTSTTQLAHSMHKGVLVTAWTVQQRLQVAVHRCDESRTGIVTLRTGLPPEAAQLAMALDDERLYLCDTAGVDLLWWTPLEDLRDPRFRGPTCGEVPLLEGAQYRVDSLYRADTLDESGRWRPHVVVHVRRGGAAQAEGTIEAAAGLVLVDALFGGRRGRMPTALEDAGPCLISRAGDTEVGRSHWLPAESDPRWLLLRDRRLLYCGSVE
ncbi:MAG TPA: zinc ribbon domain-containing protein, partial [Armatimonadota bacterium]|nr:zinc ribbon domain-containing protein [Armatimonadota bacterium]